MLTTITGSFGELFQEFQPSPARHADIQENCVPRTFPRQIECFLRTRRFTENGALVRRGKNLLQPLANNKVVIHD